MSKLQSVLAFHALADSGFDPEFFDGPADVLEAAEVGLSSLSVPEFLTLARGVEAEMVGEDDLDEALVRDLPWWSDFAEWTLPTSV